MPAKSLFYPLLVNKKFAIFLSLKNTKSCKFYKFSILCCQSILRHAVVFFNHIRALFNQISRNTDLLASLLMRM